MTESGPAPRDLPRSPPVPFTEAFRFWVWLGFVNFGGPTGQIALMHTELVERRRWVDEAGYLHALNFAMLLPGPEAHQLAIYVGWLLNGAPGALAAGVFFLLPAFALMVVLSWIYAVHGDVTWIAGLFEGLAWAVVGIVAAALLRIGGRALGHAILVVLAIVAFLALFVFGVPFPLVVLGAGAVGLIAGTRLPGSKTAAADLRRAERAAPSWGRTARVLAIGLVVWLVPLAAVALAAGSGSVLADEAVFFTIASLVTFGGAYAVLAYVNQAAVVRFGWLSAPEMAVGLSLAETTPGPLIMVVVFVGFLAAYREPASLAPVAAGVAGALVVAWATFVPSFLWIFLGAPSVERLRGNERLSGALTAITASVVGVIANLALVFATSVLFDEVDVRTPFGHEVAVPEWGSADLLAIGVALGSFVAIRRFRVNVVWVIAAAGLVGLLDALIA
ncbi:MAG TPA: chromate efflux transporter [Actinomycetota bacterium]|nr:chromate efflux transporter [Actinomycetota bacterium]